MTTQPTHRPLTYLACPYSHPDPRVRQFRFSAANRAAGMLMKRGDIVFSPISHTHPIAEACDLPKGWEYWRDFDKAYLWVSRRLVVLKIDGWKESVGVTSERGIAAEMGLPIEYMEPDVLTAFELESKLVYEIAGVDPSTPLPGRMPR